MSDMNYTSNNYETNSETKIQVKAVILPYTFGHDFNVSFENRFFNVKYVSDIINEEEICMWDKRLEKTNAPIFIWAPTGKGKNYMVTHDLLTHAKKHNKKILYIGNRVALDYQMRYELKALTGSSCSVDISSTEVDDYSKDFNYITVTTYAKFLSYEHNPKWYRQFTYVVIDECHFFYSDSYFNNNTDLILKKIISNFSESIRIYMSATIETAINPILYHEQKNSKSFIEKEILGYKFPEDFSHYDIKFVKDTGDLLNLIFDNKNSNEKWLIFTTSIEKGKELCKEINNKKNSQQCDNPTAVFLTRINRNSSNATDAETLAWKHLLKDGTLKYKVLIATSVLDNGFSIKDPSVKHIAIFTNDKTEFIQELGRRRLLSEDDKINLYIGELTQKMHSDRNDQCSKYENLILEFRRSPNADKKISEFRGIQNGYENNYSDFRQIVKNMWDYRQNYDRNIIRLENDPEKSASLIPKVNEMAMWRTLEFRKQIESFDKLYEECGENARFLYKSRWLGIDDKEAIRIYNGNFIKNLSDLIDFLDQTVTAGTHFEKNSDQFNAFRENFFKLYCSAYPEDPSIHQGRDPWFETGINNHLITLSQYPYIEKRYKLETVSKAEGKTFILTSDDNPIYNADVIPSKNKAFD